METQKDKQLEFFVAVFCFVLFCPSTKYEEGLKGKLILGLQFKEKDLQVSMVVHACNPNTWEVEAVRLGLTGILCPIMSSKLVP